MNVSCFGVLYRKLYLDRFKQVLSTHSRPLTYIVYICWRGFLGPPSFLQDWFNHVQCSIQTRCIEAYFFSLRSTHKVWSTSSNHLQPAAARMNSNQHTITFHIKDLLLNVAVSFAQQMCNTLNHLLPHREVTMSPNLLFQPWNPSIWHRLAIAQNLKILKVRKWHNTITHILVWRPFLRTSR